VAVISQIQASMVERRVLATAMVVATEVEMAEAAAVAGIKLFIRQKMPMFSLFPPHPGPALAFAPLFRHTPPNFDHPAGG
jgi:hypothetical protein